ncbi:MAG TPA: putative glycoside hydrolase [Rectinemataceae bacterium]|nr:putative glycoside hydrolase [Rectinemataceae bacterium]
MVLLALTALPALAQAGLESPQDFLAGGKAGLYSVVLGRDEVETRLIWGEGSVSSIHPFDGGWYFTGSRGIVFSADLRKFENRSAGLPLKTLKIPEGDAFTLSSQTVEIKSLAVDPAQPNRLAACTGTELWYSETSGKSWISLGSPSVVQGLKSVSFGPGQGASQHAVWVSHAIKGVFSREIDGKSGWTGPVAGLPKVFGSNGEEVSSFALVPTGGQAGIASTGPAWNFIAGLSFLSKIFHWDPARKTFVERYSDIKDFGSADSLAPAGRDSCFAISNNGIERFSLTPGNGRMAMKPDARLTDASKSVVEALRSRNDDRAICLAWIPDIDAATPSTKPLPIAIGELWRLSQDDSGLATDALRRRQLAKGKNGLYLQTGFVINPETRATYFDLIQSLGLNSLVVDMKDDYGRLRFAPRSPLLAGTDRTGQTLDIESFAAEARERGIYLIARVVVFKDEALHKWKNGALAVRDAVSGGLWQGIKADGQPIQEYWVDPYSTEVWRYNVEIAREVTARGFDEVQFDYIRFPTDGENLGNARFPSQDGSMTQDSALESFLSYARRSLEVPIGVDIYGANGWYRSGTRTGQDVEMLSTYVDVICPMLYPSHFEQAFLAQAPAELRPYRIYKIGTLRNLAIARDKAIVRPYVQAFYLNVSYDKTYYGPSYVVEEVEGVQDGANQGMTFWNNSGRYADLPSLR